MPDLKIAVIVDCGRLQRFGRDAIDAVTAADHITVFSCTNTRFARKPVRHGLYYALNLLALRNPLTRMVPIAGGTKRIAATIEFEADRQGAWQSLPPEIVDRLASFDLVLKFGMGLLRVPPRNRLPAPILSYHHGDPDLYRGRPAGFWEMAEGRRVMGQIVQAIDDRLDGGMVLACAETKVFPHSYRRTVMEAYRHSPMILNEAIRNAMAGIAVPKASNGRNYRLPSNLQVARFALAMAGRALARLAHGALLEKGWRVSTAETAGAGIGALFGEAGFPAPERWETLQVPRRYAFYADPFFSREPAGILVEALSRTRGMGEIVLVSGERHLTVSRDAGHHSYPGTIETEGGQLLLPEIAQWSPPRLYRIEDGAMREADALAVQGSPRIADPTMIEHEGRFYLFGSPSEHGTNVLWLWSADRLDASFAPHPHNPIRVSPRGARMAGGIVAEDGRLFRLGQSFERGYGDGIHLFEVLELGSRRYCERHLAELRFKDRRGPHTLNLSGGSVVFDWYRDRLSVLGWPHRLLAIVRRQRGTSRQVVQASGGRSGVG